jgi:hypothetical protein
MNLSSKPTKYSLTPEHRAQIKPWAERWVKNGLSCVAMTDQDRNECFSCIHQLYNSAKLAPPKLVLFVKSPLALVVTSAFAMTMAEKKASSEEIRKMVDTINNYPTGLFPVNYNKWHSSPYNVKELAQRFGVGEDGVAAIHSVHNMWNGGNQWSGWASYISFWRHVAKLPIDFTNWEPYERLAELSGPRTVHSEFCIISDRPEWILLNERNQPHSLTKPFVKWRDGSGIYSIDGVRVPRFVVETPDKITVKTIESERNVEIRRIMINRYGQSKFVLDSLGTVVHQDDFGTLYRKELPGDEPLMMVKVVNATMEPDGTFKDYFIRVDPFAYGGIKTARAAVASTWRNVDNSLIFASPDDYVCAVES